MFAPFCKHKAFSAAGLIYLYFFSTEITKKLFILWTNLNLIPCNFREPSHRAWSNSTQQLCDVRCRWRGCSGNHLGDRKHRLTRLGFSAASQVRGVDSHRRAHRASGSDSQWLSVKITHPIRVPCCLLLYFLLLGFISFSLDSLSLRSSSFFIQRAPKGALASFEELSCSASLSYKCLFPCFTIATCLPWVKSYVRKLDFKANMRKGILNPGYTPFLQLKTLVSQFASTHP